jgi:hypothetical protein
MFLLISLHQQVFTIFSIGVKKLSGVGFTPFVDTFQRDILDEILVSTTEVGEPLDNEDCI